MKRWKKFVRRFGTQRSQVQILSHRYSKIKGFGFPKPFDFALSSNFVLTHITLYHRIRRTTPYEYSIFSRSSLA